MKKILFPLALLFTISVNAQDYMISFAGTGEATIVDSVKVENLMKGTVLYLKGSDILHLLGTTAVNSPGEEQSSGIKIYPNPMGGSSLIEILAPSPGEAVISITDMTGRMIFKTAAYLDNYSREFRLSGLYNGLYFVTVESENYHFSGRIISISKSQGAISFEKASGALSKGEETKSEKSQKGNNVVVMSYDNGDRLLMTSHSGYYSTVVADVPTSSKTISFGFVSCPSAIAFFYPVVKIGDQVWMARNLETTKLYDGTDIAFAPSVEAPGYRYYNDDPNLALFGFGALYNWYAVGTGKLCPAGWHVPSTFEWSELVIYLGGTAVAGGKLKSTSNNWQNPNYGATNETGFSAYPGGRFYSGMFKSYGFAGWWWAGEEIPGGSYAYYRALYNESANVLQPEYLAKYNYVSVRCIKD